MGISLTRLTQEINTTDYEKINGSFHEAGINDYQVIIGHFDGTPGKCLPSYYAKEDKWYGSDDTDSEEARDIEVHFDNTGEVVLFEDYDEPVGSLKIRNLHEFLQYFNNLDGFTGEVLSAPVKFREFPLSEVVEDVYISVNYPEDESIPKETFRFAKRSDLEAVIGKKTMASLLACIFNDKFKFLTDIGSWSQFCEEHNLLEKLETISFSEVPVFYHNGVISNCDNQLMAAMPFAGFRLKETFSAQYFYDFLTTSSEGEKFLKTLSKKIPKGEFPADYGIVAPDSLVSQIRYSIELRDQKRLLTNTINRFVPSKPATVTGLKSRLKQRNDSLGSFVTSYLENNKD